jgi:hypothetical protein
VVVGLVAVALTVTAAIASGAQIAVVVERQFARALCIVSGGDCNEDRAPCTTASTTDIDDSSANILIVKVGHTQTLLLEHRSDGTWRVTLTDDSSHGIDVGLGAGVSVAGLGLKLAIGGEARASVLAHAAHGETWVAHSLEEARYDEALLVLHKHPPGKPLETFGQSGTLSTLGGSASAPGVPIGSLSYASDEIDGTRIAADGSTTIFLRRRTDLDGSLPLAGISATQVDSTQFAIRVNPSGHPIDFEVIRVGRTAKASGQPGNASVKGAGGRVDSRDAAGDAWEDEQHLDLTDPDNLAAAQAYLKASQSGDVGALAVANRALAVRLALSGVEQHRRYSLQQSSLGASGRLAIGIQVGGSAKESSTRLKLVDAQVRGPDGIWTRRDDCLLAARREK